MRANDDVELLQQLINHGGTQAFSLVPLALKKVIVEGQWQSHKDRHGKCFISFEAFVTDRGLQGLATTIKDLRVFCCKAPDVVRLIEQEMDSARKHGTNQHAGDSNTTSSTDKSRGALYTLKRLKRDHPDLFQQVIGGVKSANAAAIEAGFRSKSTPLEQIIKLLSKLTASEVKQLRAALDEHEHRQAGFLRQVD